MHKPNIATLYMLALRRVRRLSFGWIFGAWACSTRWAERAGYCGAGPNGRPAKVLELGEGRLFNNRLNNNNFFFLRAASCDDCNEAEGNECFDALGHVSLL